MTYRLRDEARFADGKPVTAEDVAFSFELLTTKGSPGYAYYYADVEKAEAIDRLTVRFHFRSTENKELPLIVGQLPVLPKHYWQDHEFGKPSLDKPLGSGPYQIESVQPGRSVETITGRRTFRSIVDSIILTSSALSTFSTKPYRWRHSRVALMTGASKTAPKTGPRAMPARH